MQEGFVRIERHRSALGRWEMVRARPHRRLRAHVRDYCGYVEETSAPMRRRELPSGDVTLILNLGEPICLVDPADGAGAGERMGSFVAGLSDSSSVTETAGSQVGVQVNFTPLGAHMFFGLPMDQIANRAVSLEDVLPDAGSVTARLSEASSWVARFDLLDATIGERLSSARPPSGEVAWAWRRLTDLRGCVGIETLARDVGWSRRHLAALFRRQVGLTPKVLARVLRFRRAVDLLQRPERHSLADIAYACGYYDQAHLNRDFRRLADATPIELLARRLPDGGGMAAM
jgi:AraC-like DNA-binding protein